MRKITRGISRLLKNNLSTFYHLGLRTITVGGIHGLLFSFGLGQKQYPKLLFPFVLAGYPEKCQPEDFYSLICLPRYYLPQIQ